MSALIQKTKVESITLDYQGYNWREGGLSFIEPYLPNGYHLVILLDLSPFGDTYKTHFEI